ncbi:hypothetical protein PHYPO_G00225380 [Pangasianodon hypophthalmus]|uniref:Uncharacterized protein n=1 Tax=Pangasianodon hypophthalmus TaxID=310915 RepID=A0A5N5NX07_PANHP|nr:hypothetical protein PHYPO_G00225380 [Pangasianodon hypophthalmus]
MVYSTALCWAESCSAQELHISHLTPYSQRGATPYPIPVCVQFNPDQISPPSDRACTPTLTVGAWVDESQTEAGTVTWSPLRTAVNGPLIPGTASCDLTLLSPGILFALSSPLSLYLLIYRAQQA